MALLRGSRIVPAKSLKDMLVKLSQESHQGVVQTKNLLRSKVWLPGMDYDVNHLCRIFHVSLLTSSCDPPERMSCVLPPCALLHDGEELQRNSFSVKGFNVNENDLPLR